MELKGSRTEQNLRDAFAGESMARNKYTYYASVAKKEGYEQIAAIFTETAANEKEHAEMEFKLLGGIGTTAQNLEDAAKGENYEWTKMYKDFEAIAREEGFVQIAELFKQIGTVEYEHEKRYNQLLENVQNGTVFKGDADTVWVCRNCGKVLTAAEPPEICPVCAHPKAYFERRCENY